MVSLKEKVENLRNCPFTMPHLLLKTKMLCLKVVENLQKLSFKYATTFTVLRITKMLCLEVVKNCEYLKKEGIESIHLKNDMLPGILHL